MIHQFRDVKSAIKYPMLKIQGETLGRILGGKRIECHVAMVPHVDWVGIVESTEKKTIMFTSFVEALEASESHVRKLGMTPLTVYGKTSNELASIVKKFDQDPKLNPLLATYASLATAVRLTMADTMLILNSRSVVISWNKQSLVSIVLVKTRRPWCIPLYWILGKYQTSLLVQLTSLRGLKQWWRKLPGLKVHSSRRKL